MGYAPTALLPRERPAERSARRAARLANSANVPGKNVSSARQKEASK